MVPSARCQTRARSGFTLVEILVVMAILGVLLALILPALSGAKKRGYKTREMNNIKHLGHAWMLYGNSNNDAALPGFLETSVQVAPVMGVSRGWGVQYKYPDATPIPLTPANTTGPWTWRLMSYLSYDLRTVQAHLDRAEDDMLTLVKEDKDIAYEPAFGYNGFYIGGWWEMHKFSGVDTPMPRFFDHCVDGTPGRVVSVPGTIAQIARASEMVAFCSASAFTGTGVRTKLPDTTAGHHMVMPPTMELKARWRPNAGNPISAVDIVEPGTWAPIPRYTGTIAVLYPDGHVDQQGYNALHDIRKWANGASSEKYLHTRCGEGP